MKQFMKENPAITKAIEDRVRRELGLVKDAKDVEVAAVCRSNSLPFESPAERAWPSAISSSVSSRVPRAPAGT